MTGDQRKDAEYKRLREQRIRDGKICGSCGEWPEFCGCDRCDCLGTFGTCPHCDPYLDDPTQFNVTNGQ